MFALIVNLINLRSNRVVFLLFLDSSRKENGERNKKTRVEKEKRMLDRIRR